MSPLTERRTGTVDANGVTICYELQWRRPDDPLLLLIMGNGVQLTEWDQAFCDEFLDRGFRLLRYDHRDCGLSSKVAEPYSLFDMADDAAALLDALNESSADVVGISLGGMVAQALTITHPDRVRSLTSIMSTSGAKGVGRAQPDVLAALFAEPPRGRAEVIEATVASARLVNAGHFPIDEPALRARAAAAYDRCYYPEGRVRQGQAVLAAGDRTAALGGVTVPTLVIHGEDDPLVSVSGGRSTAAAVPGAELLVIPGMGHLVPDELRPVFADAVAANAARADGASQS